MSATLDTLADAGPTGVTIAEVAHRAGVHETSIYRRWGTRERLILEAMSEFSADMLPMPDTGSLHQDLVVLGQALVDYGRSPLGQALMRALAATADDGEAAAVRVEFWRARFTESLDLVTRAISRGELPDTVDGQLLLETFVAPIHFRLLMTREDIDQAFLERLAHAAVQGCRP